LFFVKNACPELGGRGRVGLAGLDERILKTSLKIEID
jgi:hypothetical protein